MMHIRLAAIVSVVAGILWATCVAAPPAEHSNKSVLEGQSNFRDVGGYKTKDGKTVSKGMVFRSGQLNEITAVDLDKLEELGVQTVVNFLTPAEIESAGPDRLPFCAREINLPIDTDDGLATIILEARKNADFSKVTPDINPTIHQELVTVATDQYASLFRQIIRSDDPVVFHCSHGIHRTGTAAAILLWSLGVPWETVRNDYLLSNTYRAHEVTERIEQFRTLIAQRQSLAPEKVDMTNVIAFYVLEGSYIDATRDEIMQRFGGIDRYLTEALGLSPQEIRLLRSKMLN